MVIIILVTIAALLIIYATGIFSTNLTGLIDRPQFSIKFPSGWSELNPKEITVFKGEFISGIKRDNPPAFLGIKIRAVAGQISSLKAIPVALDKILAKDLNNFRRLSSDIININNYQALKYSYTFNAKKGVATEQRQYIILHENNAYYLVFQLKNSDAITLRPEIDAIAKSFIIK